MSVSIVREPESGEAREPADTGAAVRLLVVWRSRVRHGVSGYIDPLYEWVRDRGFSRELDFLVAVAPC